ncbi:FkbM family methyltransferase [Sediminibacterium soli]|uniref:FkbM family methyltransferase n=1 Tax=Sediminibacterium soli TaxID=2698829 RepID=UPI00137B10C0|nr:FkbM family methyltransferase [Sediminibacterium soli]NCI45448.1 FkbM family methyltransferase [Sediminibacterium soli]
MSIAKYTQLVRHIKNWPLYFKRVHKQNNTARYITRGVPIQFDVPPRFYEVFREVFMEDFYKINDLVRHLPAKPTIVDIGGNVGYFSTLIASKKADARIVAFEPMKENAAVFQSNLSLNKGLENRIQLHNAAITGNYNGTIRIFFDVESENSVIASVMDDFSTLNTASREVAALSVEEACKRYSINQIDLLKLDCEGSEYPILYEMPGHVFDRIKTIAIESHDLDEGERNTGALKKFLEAKGFSVDSAVAENNCYYLKAWRP